MGEISVRDDSDEERHSSRLLDGNVELRVDEDRSPMLVVSEDAPFTSRDVVLGNEGPAPSGSRELEIRWAVLAASTLVALLTAALTVSGLLPASESMAAAAVEPLLHGLVLLTGSVGTYSVYLDASYLSTVERNWSPSPWAYLVPGGIVVAAYLLWQLGVTDPTTLPVPALVGVAVVAAALSAVPTGPVYLYNRYRTIGLLTD